MLLTSYGKHWAPLSSAESFLCPSPRPEDAHRVSGTAAALTLFFHGGVCQPRTHSNPCVCEIPSLNPQTPSVSLQWRGKTGWAFIICRKTGYFISRKGLVLACSWSEGVSPVFPIHLCFLLVVKGSICQILPTKQDTEIAASITSNRWYSRCVWGLRLKHCQKRSNCTKCPPVPRATASKQPFPEWAQPGAQVSIYTPSITKSSFHRDSEARRKGLFQCSSCYSFNKRTNHWWFAKCHENPRAHSEIICQDSFILRSLFKNCS